MISPSFRPGLFKTARRTR